MVNSDYLIIFYDTTSGESGYMNLNGDTIIPATEYSMCFTDTFKIYAIVLSDSGFVAINRERTHLYKVYPFDNGPDYVHEGLFRIVKHDKVGFADATTGTIIIQPQYDCADFFENGKARVSYKCYKKYWIESMTGKPSMDDEHFEYDSNSWFYIDRTGNKVE